MAGHCEKFNGRTRDMEIALNSE